MPDDAIKKRLRNAKRKVISTLTLAGYTVHTFESGPFHVCADGKTDSKRIRIVFSHATAEDIKPMIRAAAPPNCLREIWQISDDGKAIVIAKVIPPNRKY